MLGLKYIKFDATSYVMLYKNGQVKKEGKGLSFYYFAPSSSIVAIPTGSIDAPYIFNEVTGDFLEVTIQGNVTFKIENPKQLAELLDFTVNDKGQYKSDDYEKLKERLINVIQSSTTSFIRKLDLRTAIGSTEALQEHINKVLSESETVKSLGIRPLLSNVFGIKATPEMIRALEAKSRESLQKEADAAIYERRNFAVEEERKIKQSELNTEIAVEEKKKEIAMKQMEREVAEAENDRNIREMKIEADIAVEEKRKSLIINQVDNDKKLADAKAYEIAATLKPYRDMDWKVLTAMGEGGAKDNIAIAFRELAENAENIQNLNITPDLLQSLTEAEQL